MGTRTMFRLAVGICIIGAVSAQYPYNSLYRGQEKDEPFRPSYYPSGGQQQYRQQPREQAATTPSPEDKAKFAKIMKQINKVNDDGSYTFGFENDDGSFRVETRTKDGLVKGKYGFVDANGQLKVTEYTAGEKSDEAENDGEGAESEEEGGEYRQQTRPAGPASRSQPLSARPQSGQPRPFYSQPQTLASRSLPFSAPSPTPYRVSARPQSFDQAPAAQTTNSNVARAPPTTDEDFNSSIEQDEPSGNAFANRQSEGQGGSSSQEDPLNNQYFRQSVTPVGASSAGARGRFPGGSAPGAGGISAAGRPLPGPYAGGAYAQQYPQGVSPGPQYGGFGGPGGPQGFPGAGAPQQFGGPSGPFQGSPQDYNGAGGFPQGGPQGFPRQAPQDFSSIGSPQAGASPQRQGQAPVQSIQNFGGFGGFNNRQAGNPGKGQGGNTQPSPDEQYVPSVELDGYSEDLDEDGYPDEPPKNGQVPTRSNSGTANAGFRPSPIGLQGGVQPGGAPSRGNAAPQLILQLGAQGGAPGAVGRFPGAQQQGPTGFQGGAPNYAPQQSFGGFPQGQGNQGFAQGFPQGFEGQGGFQGFPQQYPQSPVGGQGGQFQGAPTGGAIQNDGYPFEFGPFGGPQGFPQSGPQGFPQGGNQGFPASAPAPGFQQGNYPGQGSVQSFGGFPGSGSGSPQGFPVNGGRFAGAPSNAQGASGGAQSFISGGAYPTGGLGSQASPTPSSSSEQKKA